MVPALLRQGGVLLALLRGEDGCHFLERVDAHLHRLAHQPLDLRQLGLDRRLVGLDEDQAAELGLGLPQGLPVGLAGLGMAPVDLADRLRLLVGQPELLLESALPSAVAGVAPGGLGPWARVAATRVAARTRMTARSQDCVSSACPSVV